MAVEHTSEPPIHRALGLTDDEASAIERLLGRLPNPLELAMYAVMWSEHCSYKSSKGLLRRLPTEAPWVLVGPGENAGVIDAGDGIAVALRIESHNHPSAVEPYQGAATGVGGVSVVASAGFGSPTSAGGGKAGIDEESKRPSVQVGDPFEEKRLIEACLALYDAGLVVGIQDLGGAGLTCATSETASRGGVGMDVYVDEVPQREPGMAPFEVMTSESQERMLAIIRPEDLDEVLALCERWE